jgi:hypothetical protein
MDKQDEADDGQQHSEDHTPPSGRGSLTEVLVILAIVGGVLGGVLIVGYIFLNVIGRFLGPRGHGFTIPNFPSLEKLLPW